MRLGRWALASGVAVYALSFWANKAPHTTSEIAMLSDRLLEFGAVDFVHGLYDGPEQALFDCVAAGQELSDAQSVRYRAAYQALLLEKQGLFKSLDANLQLREDAGMENANNLGGRGIAGLHDHHDLSAQANFTQIEQSLISLKSANALKRTYLANDIYKDLTDLMVHMAPAVHSIGLLETHLRAGADFAAFYAGMKRAQSSAVNSPAYWAALEAAVQAYAQLVLATQTQIRHQNGAGLHALSGKWLALQTIAPRLSEDSPSAAARKKDGADAPPCPA